MIRYTAGGDGFGGTAGGETGRPGAGDEDAVVGCMLAGAVQHIPITSRETANVAIARAAAHMRLAGGG